MECLHLGTLKGHSGCVRAVVVLPNGHIASASNDKTIRVWNISTHKCVRILRGHTNGVYALSVLPSGRLASASLDATIRIWDMPASQLAAKGQRAAQLVRSLKRYVITHTNADPIATAFEAKLPLTANYLRRHGFVEQV